VGFFYENKEVFNFNYLCKKREKKIEKDKINLYNRIYRNIYV